MRVSLSLEMWYRQMAATILLLTGWLNCQPTEALTTFGKSNSPTSTKVPPFIPARQCYKQADCAGITGSSCVRTHYDATTRCLCGDNQPPLNGQCDSVTKALYHMCANSDECNDGLICGTPNITGKPPAHLQFHAPTDKICLCDGENGFQEKDHTCSEGESCVDRYANTVGRCTSVDQCESARVDFQQNGIRPTFCSYNTFGGALVCCRDGSNILQAAPANDRDERPVWGISNGQNDRRRVSERKCEEYSRGVVEKVDYIPLLPNPETLSISAAKCDYTGVELIVGGENANPGEFPHMAAIGWADFDDTYKFSCGGSLISPRYVVTAGHCIRDPNAKNPDPVIVRLGDQNIDNSVNDGASPIDVPIRNIIKHPDYRPPKVYNDIALFELATNVEFRAAVRPACLWTRPDFSGHNKVIATGWGVIDTRTGQTSKELQKVSLSLLENNHCDQLLFNIRNRNWQGFQPSQMCAGELRGGKDTCQGDSGSPLQVASKDNSCIFHLVGVTSFGRKCAESGRPAVYTRISSYLDWIESVVWPGE